MEPGERIDLYEIRNSGRVAADVDPAGVAAAQGPVGVQGRLLGPP